MEKLKRYSVSLIITQVAGLLILLNLYVFGTKMADINRNLHAQTVSSGPQGVQGEQGIQGIQGLVGLKGADGAQGPAGVQGPSGLQGEPGTAGEQGPQGPQGDQGDPGLPQQMVEQRINPITDAQEWRCSGDNLWTVLKNNPILQDSCL